MAQNKQNKKRTSFFKSVNFIILILVTIVISAFSFLNLFQKLDFRVYDFLLGKRAEPKQSNQILFVNIDDESINAMGEWPWSRDIIADCIIRMKELGAMYTIFDVEYLSPSPRGIAPNAEENMNVAISASKEDIATVINELSESIRQGFVSKADLPSVTQEMITNYINPSLTSMQENISSKMYRDNDDYFARAIEFFGKTYLTINTRNVAIQISDEDKAYTKNRMLISNVTDINKIIPKDNVYTSNEQYAGVEKGFSPALYSLMTHATGAGFTNVVIDNDGIRRRIELLYDYDGKYVAQLSFSPLLNILDVKMIERKRNSVVLYNAKFPGEENRVTVKIPLDEHGRMLINWLHCTQGESFKNESLLFLKDLDSMESSIITLLSNIKNNELRKDNGDVLDYSLASNNLLSKYLNITNTKQMLLDKCEGFDETGKKLNGISDDEYKKYFELRTLFFDDVLSFINANYMNDISSRLEELLKAGLAKSEVENFNNIMSEQFQLLKENYDMYMQYFTEMKSVYNNAICIIGNTASSTTDLGTNPFERSYPNVGTHANVMNTILQRDFITPLPWFYGMLFAFVIIIFATIFMHNKQDSSQNIVLGVITFSIIAIFVLLMIVFGYYVPMVAPSLFVVLVYISGIIARFMSSDKEKRFLRRAFSTYLSKDVVNAIVDDPEKLSLGGEDKHMSALFTDIKSFSGFSELVTPTQLVSILNEYLGLLSDTILEYNGTIDKYIGDAIVSFFGAPIDLPDHAFRACAAAIKMKQVEKRFNKKNLIDKTIPRALETRVGINTGNMVVGNMGTSMKMNYTIMGNDVNLASRLEGVNKVYNSWILVSEQTWNEADSGEHKGALVAKRLDKVRVVGINKPVQLYNIVGFKKEMTSEQIASIDEFHEALDLYLSKDFKKAGKMFINVHKMNESDEAALVFAQRCKNYLKEGIPKNWDGVMNMTSK